MTHEFRRPGETERHCPICHQPALERWQPFCSKRCADIDLGRWLGEDYRISKADVDDEGDDADTSSEDQAQG